MDHDRARKLLSDYLDDELAAKERDQLKHHLDGCDSCRAELASLRETLSSLSGLHDLPAPDNFAHKIEHKINRRSRGRFFGEEPLLRRLPFEWVSFLIIILLVVMYLMLNFNRAIKPADGPPARPTPTTAPLNALDAGSGGSGGGDGGGGG